MAIGWHQMLFRPMTERDKCEVYGPPPPIQLNLHAYHSFLFGECISNIKCVFNLDIQGIIFRCMKAGYSVTILITAQKFYCSCQNSDIYIISDREIFYYIKMPSMQISKQMTKISEVRTLCKTDCINLVVNFYVKMLYSYKRKQ